MSDERKRIIQMLADGKITANEAERLLVALSGRPMPDRRRTIARGHSLGNTAFMSATVPTWNLPVQM